MAILSKGCKPENFDSHSSLKPSFTNMQGLPLKFIDCESFLESSSPNIFALYETNLDDSIGSYVKEGFLFAQDLSLENSADIYLCF